MQAGKGSKQACPEAVADGRALGEQFTSPFPRRAGGKAVRSLMQVSSVLLYCRWLAGAGAISSARPSWAGCNLLVPGCRRWYWSAVGDQNNTRPAVTLPALRAGRTQRGSVRREGALPRGREGATRW